MELRLGEKIRLRRKQLGLTLKELAGDRVTAAQISAVEKGKCKPSPGLLGYIAGKLDVSTEYFTLSNEDMSRKKFDEIKTESKRYFDEKNYSAAINIIESASGMLNSLTDCQKGYFYRMKGDCFYNENNYNEAFNAFIKSITYYLKTRDIDITAELYVKIGACLYNTGKKDMAMGYYLSAYKYIELGISCNIAARILYNIALCHTFLKRYSGAREYVDKLISYIKEREWEGKDSFYPDIDMINGYVNMELAQIDEGLHDFEAAYVKYEHNNNLKGMGRARNNAALCLLKKGHKDKAVDYLNQAINIKIECEDDTLADAYIDLAELYAQDGDVDRALGVIGIAEEKLLCQNYTQGLIEFFTIKFQYLVRKEDYDKAELFAFIAVDFAQKQHDTKAEAKLYIKLSEMYKKTGDEKNSILYLLKAHKLM